jgi:hypothetical protein
MTTMENEIGEENVSSEEISESKHAVVKKLLPKILLFVDELSGHPLFPYQRIFAARIVESILYRDGATITALFSRQSGKTETVANTIATLMLLMPRFAKAYPQHFGDFRDGMKVGCFAPVETQASILFTRIAGVFGTDAALEIMADPEIDEKAIARSRLVTLAKSKSFARMQTANPKAKIEGTSYHIIIVDEAQDVDEYVMNKSIGPMGAFYRATTIETGTPTTHKGIFYRDIQANRRNQTIARSKQNHFEANWKECSKYNSNYKLYVEGERKKFGEDSDEFQLSYNLKWLLDRGMFVSESVIEELGDKTMEVQKVWNMSPVVVGIDPARKQDSTVVTVVWVGWDHPDEFGLFPHRILNWLEIRGDDWEEQYFRIAEFLSNYDVLAVGVDAQGVGDAVAQRLERVLPKYLGKSVEVRSLGSNRPEQSKRWKHLMTLIQRGLVGWPAHPHTRRLRTYSRFVQQMGELEKKYEGPHLLAAAPNEPDAHDDYADSLAIACMMTEEFVVPTVEVSNNPFFSRN